MGKTTKSTPSAPSRFVRSVNLEQDLWRPDALDGYVVTAGVRRALLRIAPATTDAHASRVWTVTGPYGTGKSVFVLFLAWLFSHVALGLGSAARRLLRASDKDLGAKILGAAGAKKDLLPVVVTGSRESLGLALLRGLRQSVKPLPSRKAAAFGRKIEALYTDAKGGKLPATTELTALFGECLDSVCEGKDAPDGLLLVIDELGKLLEHATTHTDKSDIFILQSLAEFAARSSQPFLIIGVLHQDFSLYAQQLSPRDRAEWDKVRGRFEDIAFEEPADEILRLIAQARVQGRDGRREASLDDADPELRAAFAALCEEIWKLELAPPGLGKDEFVALLHECWPLHPLVTVLLGPLFRRLAQNERSVFSFLHSAEPGSLAEHIRSERAAPSALFTVEQLYDYLVSSLGDGLYIHARGKRWAEIETVLDRMPGASPLDVAIVKTVGLLGAVGQWQQLRPTPQVLRLALAPHYGTRDADKATKTLLTQSCLASRRYSESYALWEGSDVDLDAAIRAARGKLAPSTSLADLVTRYVRIRPIVVRCHSFDRGCLRYFEVHLVSVDGAQRQLPMRTDADCCVPRPGKTRRRASRCQDREVRGTKAGQEVLVGVPTTTHLLADVVRDLACLESVKENIQELAGDATARREVRARIALVRRQVDVAVARLFTPGTNSAGDCT